MTNDPPLSVKVFSDFANFTRPEFGVERVSYEVMTPSAARGVLEAIFGSQSLLGKFKKSMYLNQLSAFRFCEMR